VTAGRTNSPEFGSLPTTEPTAWGPTRNPWNTDHSTGGSSGGSAAAVAAGIVPVAHANDGGGSIRIPASECGLVGLKPTRARVSLGPDAGEGWMGSTIDGSVTRTVRDTAAVLDAISGPMPGDPYSAPTPTRAFLDEVGVEPGKLRIGVYTGALTPGVSPHPDVVAAVEHAAALLASLGHYVEHDAPAALGEPEFQQKFLTVISAATAADIDFFERVTGRTRGPDEVEGDNLFFAEMGKTVSAVDYIDTVQWMHGYDRRVAQWWTSIHDGGSGFDLLLTPTIAQPPPPIGYLSDPVKGGERVIELLQYTAQFNVTGQPGISLQLFWNEAGLPIGVQLVAAYGREDILIRVASQLEVAQPWSGRRPPVHA
jgi:amidase